MKELLNTESIEKTVSRLAHELLEKHSEIQSLILVGIRTRGVFLAERLKTKIKSLSGHDVSFGTLDITLYRDDLSEIGNAAEVRETEISENLDGKNVVLVDDVLYTGRTIRSALNALTDFGRPNQIQLLVLVDRGHRELPIKADFVGKNIPTSKTEHVAVYLQEVDGREGVVMEDHA